MPNQSISPPTRQANTRRGNETPEQQETTGGQDEHGDDEANDETKTHGPRKTTSKQRDDKRDARQDENETTRRTTTMAKASNQGRSEENEKNKTVSFLTFRPTPSRLFSLIRRPQLFPRPPGVGRAGGETNSPCSSPIRCLGWFLSLTPRPSSALARRIFSSPASSLRTRRSR